MLCHETEGNLFLTKVAVEKMKTVEKVRSYPAQCTY